MAGTYLRRPLSGSTDGRGILVVATATAGTLIHTAQASATLIDALYLEVYNDSTAAVTLTIEWGGVTDPNDLTVLSIPAGAGRIPVVVDGVIRNSLVVRAFASTGSVITVYGFALIES